MSDTFERVKALFIEKLDIKDEALRPEATLESLGLDSLDKIEFVFSLEDEFKISFPEKKVELNTVQDVINVIDRLIAEKQGKA